MLDGLNPLDWFVEVSCQSRTPAVRFMVSVGLKTWLNPRPCCSDCLVLHCPVPLDCSNPKTPEYRS